MSDVFNTQTLLKTFLEYQWDNNEDLFRFHHSTLKSQLIYSYGTTYNVRCIYPKGKSLKM